MRNGTTYRHQLHEVHCARQHLQRIGTHWHLRRGNGRHRRLRRTDAQWQRGHQNRLLRYVIRHGTGDEVHQFGQLAQRHIARVGAVLLVRRLYQQYARVVWVEGVRERRVLHAAGALDTRGGGDGHQLGGLGDQHGQQRLPGETCFQQ